MALQAYLPFTRLIETCKTIELLTTLLASDMPQAIQILQSILSMWVERDKEGLRKYIGRVADSDIVGGRLMYTLTPDGRQFRAWYGIPGSMDDHYVDSCGTGNLLSIRGNREELEQLIPQLLPPYILPTKIVLPNGVWVYGLLWKRTLAHWER